MVKKKPKADAFFKMIEPKKVEETKPKVTHPSKHNAFYSLVKPRISKKEAEKKLKNALKDAVNLLRYGKLGKEPIEEIKRTINDAFYAEIKREDIKDILSKIASKRERIFLEKLFFGTITTTRSAEKAVKKLWKGFKPFLFKAIEKGQWETMLNLYYEFIETAKDSGLYHADVTKFLYGGEGMELFKVLATRKEEISVLKETLKKMREIEKSIFKL